MDPVSHAVGNVTLTLYTVPTDTTGTVTIGGRRRPSPSARPAIPDVQRDGQQVTVRVTSNTFGWVTARLKRPDGTVLTSLQGFGNFNLPTQTLPTTGTYTIEVDPAARPRAVSTDCHEPIADGFFGRRYVRIEADIPT